MRDNRDILDRLRWLSDDMEQMEAPGEWVQPVALAHSVVFRQREEITALREENAKLREAYEMVLTDVRRTDVDMREMLAENKRLRAAQQWLPIESAPRDGTAIIGAAYWTMADGVYRLGWMAEGYLDGDRWSFASFDLDADEFSLPTHWMPLPAPPALTSEKEEGNG